MFAFLIAAFDPTLSPIERVRWGSTALTLVLLLAQAGLDPRAPLAIAGLTLAAGAAVLATVTSGAAFRAAWARNGQPYTQAQG